MNECPHRHVRIVWTAWSSFGETFATRQLRQYCDDCGRLFGSALKHTTATPETPEISFDEVTRYHREWQERLARNNADRKAREQRRRAEYIAYLQTDAWVQRRELVIERAGGMCEGCRQAAAEQVHHLTYNHITNEFLWELVAICRDCHERFHDVTDDVRF
jgi:5-methylcytosine-specific restriction endonuclease McrA